MRTKYLFLLTSLLILGSCEKAKDTDTNEDKKQIADKSGVTDESVTFLNKQILNIQYQIDAIELGNERISNVEIKRYLNDNLSKLNVLLKDFQMEVEAKGKTKSAAVVPESDVYKKDLYKLSIADAKNFDNIFLLYYKDFLNKNVKELGATELHNEKANALKNKYGNILYEQKLYFDVNNK